MGNELKIMLGSGIVIILTDYFKMIGEETRKNRSVIGDIIKFIISWSNYIFGINSIVWL